MALEVLPLPRAAAGAGTPAGTARFITGSLGPDDQFASYWGKTRPAILGIVSRPLDGQEQARLRRQDGIVVETVLNGSPAAAAGIAVGDVVVAIGGQNLPDPRAVPEIVTALAGQQVDFELIRDGRPMSVTVQLNPASL
jgi:S1-C subfamily serine protease